MIFRELALPEPLRRAALCGWQFLVEPDDPVSFQHMVPPDGAINLTLIRAPDGAVHARLVGPMLAAFAVPAGKGFAYAGLRLRPEMARLVTGAAPQAGMMAEAALDGPLAPVWQDLAALAGGATDWRGTVRCLATAGPRDEAVAAGVDLLIASGGTCPLARLAAPAGLSARQFRRRFHAATGVAPKQYADVQRVRRALVLALSDADWAGIAHDSGFADQPHLVRDIKDRFGAAPRRVAGYFGGMRHELIDLVDVRILQANPAKAA
jgi:AraC-like DNA-binding protein